jgi:lincosamide nucleotidyltransferase A/C/D/E
MTDDDVDGAETSLAEVLDVLRALSAVGCRFWLEGGWGVDALVGRQTRPLHPLLIGDDGTARQAALQGGFHVFPRSFFVTGSLAGVPVPCVSVTAQRLFHTGYQPRDIDLHDLAVLDWLDRGDSDAVPTAL